MINKARGQLQEEPNYDDKLDEPLDQVDLELAELFETTLAEVDSRLDGLQTDIAYLTRSVRGLAGFICIGVGLLILHTGTQLQQQWHQLWTWVQSL
jgi:hypothetical protein